MAAEREPPGPASDQQRIREDALRALRDCDPSAVRRAFEAILAADDVDLSDAVGMPGGGPIGMPGGQYLRMRVAGPDYSHVVLHRPRDAQPAQHGVAAADVAAVEAAQPTQPAGDEERRFALLEVGD